MHDQRDTEGEQLPAPGDEGSVTFRMDENPAEVATPQPRSAYPSR